MRNIISGIYVGVPVFVETTVWAPEDNKPSSTVKASERNAGKSSRAFCWHAEERTG